MCALVQYLLLCYVLFLYTCFCCMMESPAVPTTIHCSPDSPRGQWLTKHTLIDFFVNHVNQHCCLVWGVYEKYRKRFLPKLAPNTNRTNLKKIVDSNFEYVKPTILSMMNIDPSQTFNSREEGRERVVAHLLEARKNRTNGRLRRGEITNASNIFRLSIHEVKNVWQEYIRKEREEKKKTTTSSIGAGSSSSSLLDVDSLCHSLLTQDTTMREEDGKLSLLPH